MLISQSEYARRQGVSRAYIGKLVKQGKLPTTGGKIDPAVADKALKNSSERPVRVDAPTRVAARAGDSAPSGPPVPGTTSLLQAKTVFETYRAKREKLEYEKESGRLVDVDDIRKAQEKAYSIVRSRLLQIPSKLTPILMALTSRAEIKAALQAEVTAALNELVQTAGNVDGD